MFDAEAGKRFKSSVLEKAEELPQTLSHSEKQTLLWMSQISVVLHTEWFMFRSFLSLSMKLWRLHLLLLVSEKNTESTKQNLDVRGGLHVHKKLKLTLCLSAVMMACPQTTFLLAEASNSSFLYVTFSLCAVNSSKFNVLDELVKQSRGGGEISIDSYQSWFLMLQVQFVQWRLIRETLHNMNTTQNSFFKLRLSLLLK